MAYGIENISLPRLVGCMDPQASNYNPLATDPCGPIGPPQLGQNGTYSSGCCIYPNSNVTGCMDPQASNYNPNASISCSGCCQYDQSGGVTNSVLRKITIPINPGAIIGNIIDLNDPCQNLIVNISEEGVVYNGEQPIKEECCDQQYVGQPVFWDGSFCNIYTSTDGTLCENLTQGLLTTEEIENRILCVDCDNFAWWDNLYTTLNGDSLQNINIDLWDYLVSVITADPTSPLNPNFGNGSFYIDALTGEPIVGKECCHLLPDSNYVEILSETGELVSACLCNTEQETELDCYCIDKVDEFIALASTVEGNQLLMNISTLTSLGLNLDQANFVISNLFNPNDYTGDNIPDNINAKLLISNVLYLTGGFYVCFEKSGKEIDYLIGGSNQPNTLPVAVNSTKCTELGGYFDGILCYCKPQENCNLRLRDVQISTTLDQYNQQVSVVTFNGDSITEACCLQLAEDNNLPWSYELYNGDFQCFTKDPNPCLPLEFNLNRDLIKPECENPLDISVSFYFKTPDNICVEPEEDDDIIIIDPEVDPCLLTFDEENNLIDYNTAKPIRPSLLTPTPINEDGEVNDGEPCCFNPNTPIQTQLVIKDDKNNVVHTSESFSFTQFESWYDITTQYQLPTTGTTEGYNVSLQFTSGLNCCCVYDIFLDNFSFSCSEDEVITETIKDKCPGIDIVPVIDNKKSWVYNPGDLNYSGIRNQAGRLLDNDIINGGETGLIGGYGTINRTFAPSPDADLPWRYTDYFNQSSVLEKHSNLVLNSKELYLTFDMCSIGGPCPDGYTLSAGTETCYKYINTCPDGYTLSAGTCYSGVTTATTTQELVTEESDPLACKTKFTLLQLENYKKTFQSFWLNFVEQFVPATTIFISGEKWCNRPDEICTQYDECDFDFEFVEGDVTTKPNTNELGRKPVTSQDSNTVEPNTGGLVEQKSYNPLDYKSTKDGPIDTPTVKVLPLPKEDGETTIIPSIVDNLDERLKRKEDYQKKLQPIQIFA